MYKVKTFLCVWILVGPLPTHDDPVRNSPENQNLESSASLPNSHASPTSNELKVTSESGEDATDSQSTQNLSSSLSSKSHTVSHSHSRQDVSHSHSQELGVSHSPSQHGVSHSQQDVSHSHSQEQGVSHSHSREQGVSHSHSQEQGVSHSHSQEQDDDVRRYSVSSEPSFTISRGKSREKVTRPQTPQLVAGSIQRRQAENADSISDQSLSFVSPDSPRLTTHGLQKSGHDFSVSAMPVNDNRQVISSSRSRPRSHSFSIASTELLSGSSSHRALLPRDTLARNPKMQFPVPSDQRFEPSFPSLPAPQSPSDRDALKRSAMTSNFSSPPTHPAGTANASDSRTRKDHSLAQAQSATLPRMSKRRVPHHMSIQSTHDAATERHATLVSVQQSSSHSLQNSSSRVTTPRRRTRTFSSMSSFSEGDESIVYHAGPASPFFAGLPDNRRLPNRDIPVPRETQVRHSSHSRQQTPRRYKHRQRKGSLPESPHAERPSQRGSLSYTTTSSAGETATSKNFERRQSRDLRLWQSDDVATHHHRHHMSDSASSNVARDRTSRSAFRRIPILNLGSPSPDDSLSASVSASAASSGSGTPMASVQRSYSTDLRAEVHQNGGRGTGRYADADVDSPQGSFDVPPGGKVARRPRRTNSESALSPLLRTAAPHSGVLTGSLDGSTSSHIGDVGTFELSESESKENLNFIADSQRKPLLATHSSSSVHQRSSLGRHQSFPDPHVDDESSANAIERYASAAGGDTSRHSPDEHRARAEGDAVRSPSRDDGGDYGEASSRLVTRLSHEALRQFDASNR